MQKKNSQGQRENDPLLPHSKEAEISVLGACLIDPECLPGVMSIVQPQDFFLEWAGQIYQAMLDLFEDNQSFDQLTLWDYMGGDPKLASRLSKIIELTPTSLRVRAHARIVKDHSRRRRLIGIAGSMTETVWAGDPDEVQNWAIGEIASSMIGSGSRMRSAKDLIHDYYDLIESLARDNHAPGLMTGFKDLDTLISGFQPGDLIYLAARPSMGKSSLALAIARNVASQGKRVGFFSIEMPSQNLIMRLTSMETSIPISKLKKAQLSEEEWTAFFKGIDQISALPLMIDDTPGIHPGELLSKAIELKGTDGLDLIVIDYLQLMRSKGRTENRRVEVMQISQALKAMAKNLGIPVLALSQLSRACEQRSNKRPQLSDLRESGDLEQDADLVIFIYRDDYYDADSEQPNIAELLVSKHRNGPTGTVMLFFDRGLTRFEDLKIKPGDEYVPPENRDWRDW